MEQRYQSVGIDEIRPHPSNPRLGNVSAIRESIEKNGFYGAIVVQSSTGHVLAGNHRWMAAKAQGMATVPVIYVDVDDDRALRILLGDNHASDIGAYDDDALGSLLASLALTEGGLDGTGYTGDDLSRLVDAMADEAAKRDLPPTGSLSEKFGAVPFSVLNAREGWWQDRKRQWISLGIESEAGRVEDACYAIGSAAKYRKYSGKQGQAKGFDRQNKK